MIEQILSSSKTKEEAIERVIQYCKSNPYATMQGHCLYLNPDYEKVIRYDLDVIIGDRYDNK